MDQRTVEAIGGSWDADLVCTGESEPDAANRTSAAATTTAATFGSDTYLDDGLPVVFSWPVRTDTITPESFRFTLNTGEEGAEYPVRLEIVDEGTPLMLAGPSGDVSAVGLTWETDNTPYASGPKLVEPIIIALDDPMRIDR